MDDCYITEWDTPDENTVTFEVTFTSGAVYYVRIVTDENHVETWSQVTSRGIPAKLETPVVLCVLRRRDEMRGNGHLTR